MGTLYIISAPSGCGKTTLVNALVQSAFNICASISYTTRPPRPNEHSGINYHFISPSEFEQLIEQAAFLEYAKVFGYYYGTGLNWVQQKLAEDQDVILEIDWQGARQIKAKLPNAKCIFILPPSWETLESRLQQRGQDSPTIISDRMQQAKSEMSHYAEYDYLIVNATFEQALSDLKAITTARRLRVASQAKALNQLIKTLL